MIKLSVKEVYNNISNWKNRLNKDVEEFPEEAEKIKDWVQILLQVIAYLEMTEEVNPTKK